MHKCKFEMTKSIMPWKSLTRAIAYAKHIADTWNVLSTISTEGFSEFRNNLGTASGQLSFMYRHVEFVLGNKSKKLATAHKNVAHVWPEIEKSLKCAKSIRRCYCSFISPRTQNRPERC